MGGSPDDPFGIMEIAVTGVLTCPVTEIHEAKPAATYFEGKKVYGN